MNVQRFAAVGSVVAVVAAVVGGFWVIGSPAEQRLLRLDEQRVNELRQLANAAQARWNRNESLPETVAGLVDGTLLTRLPTDPTTREPYEYRALGQQQFELCAEFDRPSRPELAGDFYFHEAGRRCFMFDVTERRD